MSDLTPFDHQLLRTFRIAAEPIPDTRTPNPVILPLEEWQRLTALAEQGDPEGWRQIASDHFNAAAHWQEEYSKERRGRLDAEGAARAAVWFCVALAVSVVVGVWMAAL